MESNPPAEQAAAGAQPELPGSPPERGGQAGLPAAATWDAALGAALRDMPVPAGLSARIVSRLREPAIAPAVLAASAQLPAAGRGRRRWLKVAAGLACAASLAAVIAFFNQPTVELGSESVMDLVRAFHNQPAAAQPLRHDAPPADYALEDFVVPGYVVGWVRLASPLLGREGVAYQLAGPQHHRATLYVVDLAGPRSAPRLWLNTTSPLENLLTTDGQTSAAWTDGTRLYVLVADGDEQAYRALVRAPRSMA